MAAIFVLPKLPYPDFALRPHRNGQWYKSVWNARTKKPEHFYFGTWADDLKGDRALKDPNTGWLARKDAIRAGIDNPRVEAVAGNLSLGELMIRFLTFKRGKVGSGELSLATLDGYLREVKAFVAFQKPGAPAGGLRPEHFSAYAKHLVEHRKLGRFARKRVLTYVTTFLRFGAKNDWITMPNTGVEWVAPATDPDSMRLARSRAGIPDFSSRIVTGPEIDRLLERSQPAYKAMILLGINCGLGPADLGRLRWSMIDMTRRRLNFPRPKTGTPRVGFLWKKTVDALLRVRKLRHNRVALMKEGESSLVFITRKNQAYYREKEVHADVEVGGHLERKLVGIKIDNAIIRTFGRMVRQLKIEGLSFYRLRHSFKTLGKRAKDREALDLMMGHKDASVSKVYDHEEIEWLRIHRVVTVIHRRLWHKAKPKVEKPVTSTPAPHDLDEETTDVATKRCK